jgi:hypothetical protein
MFYFSALNFILHVNQSADILPEMGVTNDLSELKAKLNRMQYYEDITAEFVQNTHQLIQVTNIIKARDVVKTNT